MSAPAVFTGHPIRLLSQHSFPTLAKRGQTPAPFRGFVRVGVSDSSTPNWRGVPLDRLVCEQVFTSRAEVGSDPGGCWGAEVCLDSSQSWGQTPVWFLVSFCHARRCGGCRICDQCATRRPFDSRGPKRSLRAGRGLTPYRNYWELETGYWLVSSAAARCRCRKPAPRTCGSRRHRRASCARRPPTSCRATRPARPRRPDRSAGRWDLPTRRRTAVSRPRQSRPARRRAAPRPPTGRCP